MKEKAIIFHPVRKKTEATDKFIDILMNYCDKNNLTIINIFNDVSTSTQRGNKIFSGMLNFVKKKKYEINIVCDSMDNIFHDFLYFSDIISLIKNQKIKIHLIKENLIIDNCNLNDETLTRIQFCILARKIFISNLSYKIRRAKRLTNPLWQGSPIV